MADLKDVALADQRNRNVELMRLYDGVRTCYADTRLVLMQTQEALKALETEKLALMVALDLGHRHLKAYRLASRFFVSLSILILIAWVWVKV